jgi:DNA polymerase III subunit beta
LTSTLAVASKIIPSNKADPMHITVETAQMLKALYRVLGITEKKNSQAMLSHVLLDARAANQLQIYATDHVLSLVANYPVETKTLGAIALSAHALHDIVKSLSEPTLQLECQANNRVEIRSGQSQFRLAGLSADDFPRLPEVADAAFTEIPASTLVQLIDRTIFCAALEDTSRPYLNGAYFEIANNGMLQLVATDGHRLAVAKAQLDSASKRQPAAIIPRKALQELKRVLADGGAEKVSWAISSRQAIFHVGQLTFWANLIEGQFPQYQSVIPQAVEYQIKLPRIGLMEALKRVSLLSQSHAWGVKLHFSQRQLELVAEDPELGDAREMLELSDDVPVLSIGFNARYLLDVLALIPEQCIVFDVSNELSPAIIRPLEDPNFFAVVMPMRF